TGEKTKKAVKNLKPGEAILLENIRFEKHEFFPDKKNNKLIKLAELADIYVNDAFSVCHRNHFSITVFPRYLKTCAGRLLEKEVRVLKKIKIKNSLYILGGAKPKDYLTLLKQKNKILACGLFGQSCLIAKGKNLGAQNNYLRKQADLDKKLIKQLKNNMKNIKTPIDFAVKINNKRVEIPLENFPSKYGIFDIGEKTINLYVKEIKKAKSIYMKGPPGASSLKEFEKGTKAILKAISKNKGFSLIGGGHLADAIKKSKIPRNRFSHISLSGGALLSYVAGKKLPGLEALK
ncbi:phosphoglycerate kinase, partial [Candidatus Pacearchaeota archaeon]|nr:phosphoglycerate kinase [Candidatus Pacearchaeota archaeon]